MKLEGLYQNKVNSSLASIRNCKMAYLSKHGNLSNVVFTKSFKFIKYSVEFTKYSIESIEISRNS